jgi:hypothetical protein
LYFVCRTWKEYLSYKKECDNEKRRVEKMTNEGRDEYDVKKAVGLKEFLKFKLILVFSTKY